MKPFKLIIILALVLRGITPTFASDSLSIEGFLSTKNIKAEKMLEGIFFTVTTEGAGEMPRQGDFVKIRYVGKMLNGKVFDQSPDAEPYVFQLGNGQVIKGWNKSHSKAENGHESDALYPCIFGLWFIGHWQYHSTQFAFGV